MTIFLDSANIEEIKKYSDWGIISGVTTNQKIWLKEKGINFKEKLKEILDFMKSFPISVELTKTNKPLHILIEEAKEYVKLGNNVVIKVPMWKNGNGLMLTEQLKKINIPVNMTCCMNVSQAVLACEVEAKYVSLFYRRIIDFHKNETSSTNYGLEAIRRTRQIIDQQGYNTKIIAGSIRNPWDVTDCLLAGVHIVTVTPKILEKLPFHEKTEETIKEFDEAWSMFLKK